jgi:hypothetical protein
MSPAQQASQLLAAKQWIASPGVEAFAKSLKPLAESHQALLEACREANCWLGRSQKSAKRFGAKAENVVQAGNLVATAICKAESASR